ncbi:MAG: hypothetical protein HN909_03585 [Phycisphaerales bacterium]|nr:hypothetical protein [Phycisphaerales bacterium]MBT7170834.1 hypothetical protein [Phycisphaerales bacterium]
MGCDRPKPPSHQAPPRVVRYGPARELATLADRSINESSGLAVSWRQPGLLWTHNDSGDGPELFAIDHQGKTRARLWIDGAQARDWEDMCSFQLDQKAWLLIADTGDNDRRRKILTLYLVEEPVVDFTAQTSQRLRTRPTQVIRLRYSDGCHDVESIAFDVSTRTIYLLTKRSLRKCLYALTLPVENDPDRTHILSPVGVVADLYSPNAMDISSDGQLAVICTYRHAFLYSRRDDQTWPEALAGRPTMVRLPKRRQGESICFGRDGRTLFLTSEKNPAPLWQLDVLPPSAPSGKASK